MNDLRQLERTGQYLFHGSSTPGIEEFVPRQAMSFGKPDEHPAVFASEAIAPPIFMAVLGNKGAGGWNNHDKEGFGFYVSETLFDQAKQENWKGYVYVLPRESFTKRADWEWRSEQNVKPIAVFEVGIPDLPSGIEIMPHDAYVALARTSE